MTCTAFVSRTVAVTRPVAGSTRCTAPWLDVPHSEPAPTASTSGMFRRVRVTTPVSGSMRLTDPSPLPLVTQSAPAPGTGGAGADRDRRAADAVGPRVDADDGARARLGLGHPDPAVRDRDPGRGGLEADEGRDAAPARIDPVDAIAAVTLAGHPDTAGADGDVAQLLAGSGHGDGGHDPGGGRVNPVDHAGADNPYTPVTGRKVGDSRAQVGPADDDKLGSGPWRRVAGRGTRNRAPQGRGARGRRHNRR